MRYYVEDKSGDLIPAESRALGFSAAKLLARKYGEGRVLCIDGDTQVGCITIEHKGKPNQNFAFAYNVEGRTE